MDLDLLKHSLSMPTRPSFHSISDAALVATYSVERAKDPAAFDKKTASIRDSLIAEKIRRGGSNFLAHGDYTVALASREDAAKAERWKHGKKSEDDIDEGEESGADDLYGNADKVRKWRYTKRGVRGSGAEQRRITPPHLTNLGLAANVSEYTTSGSLRQQSTRRVEEDESGTKTTYTTWIEIKQELFVPRDKDVEREDVVEAMATAKVRKKWQAWKKASRTLLEMPAMDEAITGRRAWARRFAWTSIPRRTRALQAAKTTMVGVESHARRE